MKDVLDDLISRPYIWVLEGPKQQQLSNKDDLLVFQTQENAEAFSIRFEKECKGFAPRRVSADGLMNYLSTGMAVIAYRHGNCYGEAQRIVKE